MEDTTKAEAIADAKKWYHRLGKWIHDRFAATWHYLWAFLSNDPKNDITFLIFAAASITSIVLAVKYMGKFTDNDVKIICILQGGGTLPQSIKIGASVAEAIRSKI